MPTPVVKRINTNTVLLSWTSDSATDLSWVIADGSVIVGPIRSASTERSVQVSASSAYTYFWDIIDQDTKPEVLFIAPNYRPTISWDVVTGAQSYTLAVDGELLKVVRADTSLTDRQEEQLDVRLSEGWHELTVVASQENGHTEESEVRWFRVYAPGASVPSMDITDGSISGLFDITIP